MQQPGVWFQHPDRQRRHQLRSPRHALAEVATPPTVPSVRVVSAAESAARDRAAIGAGIPSRALMRAAGMAAATMIGRRWPGRLSRGVAVYVGPGNNGGDGWVTAAAFAAAGIRVRVVPTGPTRTDDAAAERAAAEPLLTSDVPDQDEA